MYLAAKYAGIEKPCTFDSGSHVTFAMKLVELNLFVWLLITLGITKLATRTKKWKRTSYRSLIVSLIQGRLALNGKVANFIRTVRRRERTYYKRRNHNSN